MTAFLLKSTVSMAVMLGLYYLLFEREKMHRFNRFYLLAALISALAIPFLTVYTFIEYVEMPEIPPTYVSTEVPHEETILIEEAVNYWPYICWGVYIIVAFIMMVRFAKNIFYFITKANSNPKATMGKAKLVLLEEKILPHTFLNYIFVSRDDYDAKQIEDELYTHEYTHVKQRHTLDILFIEALRIVFWFNPLLYFYKRAIQLNHEFLADEKVLGSNSDTIQYQTLLLSKAQNNTSFELASQLTFSLTKKRLIMMTKTTSATKATLLKFSTAPMIALLLMFLCTKTMAQETLKDIPRENIKRLDVNKKVTQKQVDSLRKVNPKIYKSKNAKDYAETSVSYIDGNGKTARKKFFVEDSATETPKMIKNELADIPSDRIKSMTVYKNVTQQQIDSLKQVSPNAYISNNPKDYGIIDLEYAENDDKILKKRIFVEQ